MNICSVFPHFNKHARLSYANGCSDYLRRLTPCFRGKPLMQLGDELPFNVCPLVRLPTTHRPKEQQIPTPDKVFVVLRTFYKAEVSNRLTSAYSLSIYTSECLSVALGHHTRLVCHSYRRPRSAPNRQQTSKKIMLIKSHLISIYTTASGM